MKFRFLALGLCPFSVALAADDESNLVLLDTQNPAIRDLARVAGDESSYDGLDAKNKIGVFYSEGLVDEIKPGSMVSYPGFNLLGKSDGSSWSPASFFHSGPGLHFTVNSDGIYQPLPTEGIPWKATKEKLYWVSSNTNAPVTGFKSKLLDPALKTRVYKRFEFPTRPDYKPEGSGLLGGVKEYDTDRAGIAVPQTNPKVLKLIVVVHGWNTDPDVDPFNDGDWPDLMENLHDEIEDKKVYAPGWDLYAYRWGQDSYTGSAPLANGGKYHMDGGVGIGLENGTQAAEIGYQHGLLLGKLIDDHCQANGVTLDQVQFIAHSAGTWVARSASLYLNGRNPGVRQQITLLDPYNPGAALSDISSGWFNGKFYDQTKLDSSNLDTDKINNWPATVSALRSENIFSDDAVVPGTNSVYASGFVNEQVGETSFRFWSTGASDFGTHSGPIRFFTFSADPGYIQTYSIENELESYAVRWNRETKGLVSRVGWEKSLLVRDYRAAKPPAITNAGASVLSSLLNSAAGDTPRYAPDAGRWKQIFVDVDENAWVRVMLVPKDGGAAALGGPVRMEDDGSFSMVLTGGGTLTGSFDTGITPARVSLAVNGEPFGLPTNVAQGSNLRRGVDAVVNSAGNVVCSMALADGTVALNVAADPTGTGWGASGTGTVDENGSFRVLGSNNFASGGRMDDSGVLDTDTVTVDPPQVPEIVVEDANGKVLRAGNSQLLFANTPNGSSSSPQGITIRNTGTVPLIGLAVSAAGSNSTDFRVNGSTGTSLAPGSSVAINVAFSPSGNGSRQGVVRIESNDSDESPFEVIVKGTGVSPEIDVLLGTKSLVDGKSTVSYGTAKPGVAVKRTFTIRNRGTAQLSLSGITKNGRHVKDFTVSALKTTKLVPGASTTLTVTFKPAAAGVRNAAIHLINNDSNESPYDIKLTGTGKSATKQSADLVELVMGGLKLGAPMLDPVVGTVLLSDGRRYLTLAVRRGPEEVRPVVEVSPNLVDWFSGPRHTTILQDDGSWFRVRDNTPVTQENKRFIRVEPGQ